MASRDELVSEDEHRSVWARALSVALVLGALAFFSGGPARRSFDAVMLAVFPHRVTMQVAPGNVQVRAGSPLGINARLVGGATPQVAQVEMGEGNQWRTIDMTIDPDGRFRVRIDAVTSAFKYRVIAGSVTSPTYSVALAYPPRVTKIAVDYSFPDAFRLKPRHELRGDIDAPSGTNVELHVFVDKPAFAGVLSFASGERMPLSLVSANELAASLMIAKDNAYRVLLAGTDGVRSDGDREYAIHITGDGPRGLRPSTLPDADAAGR
jgi:hypothetical protein